MALFAFFGSSRHLVVGADSATAAILAAGMVGLAATGSDEYVALAAVLAFMSAGFLIIARMIGLGFLADFLSRTVLIGFLTGVGMYEGCFLGCETSGGLPDRQSTQRICGFRLYHSKGYKH
jgi:SulP family sulfate permease